jgi:glycosyltransferase involved in cell wall biosynthesis
MKVFMLGWEFPPYISGGLGTACFGLTKALDNLGVEVTFVLPRAVEGSYTSHVRMLSPASLLSQQGSPSLTKLRRTKIKPVDSVLQPYTSADDYSKRIEAILLAKRSGAGQAGSAAQMVGGLDYAGDMFAEVHRYAAIVAELASKEDFDIIHAHDWMTYPAAIAVAELTGKPLVVHVHSTEFDRSGENVNQVIYDIERAGMHSADRIITVSNFTRNIVINRYGISPQKIDVVYNGVERNGNSSKRPDEFGIKKNEKIVLFLGRITMQKGPEYFLQAAKKVIDEMDDVRFVMAGSGDMMHRAVEMAAELGIGSKVMFTGFLRGEQVQEIYKMADLFVMPSVSEPFGLVPLEALENDVPVIISKQSGVAEVLTHALKVDFWDVNEMANKIVAVLRYPPLGITLRNYGNSEVRKMRWRDAAVRCSRIYEEVLTEAVPV